MPQRKWQRTLPSYLIEPESTSGRRPPSVRDQEVGSSKRCFRGWGTLATGSNRARYGMGPQNGGPCTGVIASSGGEPSHSAACERESVEFDGDRAVCQNGYVEEALVADFRAVRAGEHVMEAGGRGNGRVLIAVLTVPRRELASIGRLAGVVGA